MKVAHVAGHVERCDLAFAVPHLVVPRGEAVGDQARVIDGLARGHEVVIRAHLVRMYAESKNSPALNGIQNRPPVETMQEARHC